MELLEKKVVTSDKTSNKFRAGVIVQVLREERIWPSVLCSFRLKGHRWIVIWLLQRDD